MEVFPGAASERRESVILRVVLDRHSPVLGNVILMCKTEVHGDAGIFGTLETFLVNLLQMPALYVQPFLQEVALEAPFLPCHRSGLSPERVNTTFVRY